jgi:hypothetical protein
MAGMAALTETAERATNGVSADHARALRAAWAFTTRRVRLGPLQLSGNDVTPRAGDLVLARVDAIGHHSTLQLPSGRRKTLFPGDEIVVAYGNRYAPNQFEAIVPKTLGPCQLVAAGGVAGKALSWHARVTRGPTQITPIGLLAGPNGEPVSLRDYALPPIDSILAPAPPVLAVVGTAMDSGKTTTCAHLVRGLTLAGLRAGFAKVTGTGSGGDTWLLADAGANPVLDFTDAGLVSTYLVPPDEIAQVFVTLVGHLAHAGVDVVVIEVADGVLQMETAALLESPAFRGAVHGVLFAACDAMGALAGERWLRSRGLPILALSGLLTAAPLQRAESSIATGLPAFSRTDLARPNTAIEVLSIAERLRSGAGPNGASTDGAHGLARPDASARSLADDTIAPAVDSVAATETPQ